jgi:hypothetical protein
MYQEIYLYMKDLTLLINDSKFSFLINSNFGLYFPAIITLFAFPFTLKKSENKIYSISFCLAIFLTVAFHLMGIGIDYVDTPGYRSVNFFSYFPFIVLVYILYMGLIKKIHIKMNRYWMFMGTFSSMLFADVYLSTNTPEIIFSFKYIGGAGLLDGLFIASTMAWIGSVLQNKAIDNNLMKNNLT